jgi:hypothetical protein
LLSQQIKDLQLRRNCLEDKLTELTMKKSSKFYILLILYAKKHTIICNF